MYNIDKSILDTQGKLLFNISEQLAEIISLLKPQKTNEMERFRELQGIETQPEEFGFKCKCGKAFEKKRQLTAHKIKCKNKG